MFKGKWFTYFWYTLFALLSIFLVYITTMGKNLNMAEWGVPLFIIIGVLACLCEYMDSSIGMGYGTILTPTLIIMGYPAKEIVPIVLVSEFLTGLSAGLLHQEFGNVNFKDPRTKKMSITLFVCSFVGVIASVILALKLPKDYVNAYIGLMLMAMGVFMIFGKSIMGTFSMKKIVALGTIAAFNKGISGGGYGPLMTGGQILSGVNEKEAIGVTSLIESMVCLVGVGIYLYCTGFKYNYGLMAPIIVGALASVPLAAKSVQIVEGAILKKTIIVVTIFLGLLTLLRLSNP